VPKKSLRVVRVQICNQPATVGWFMYLITVEEQNKLKGSVTDFSMLAKTGKFRHQTRGAANGIGATGDKGAHRAFLTLLAKFVNAVRWVF